jgi:hypothetical protein
LFDLLFPWQGSAFFLVCPSHAGLAGDVLIKKEEHRNERGT